MGLPHYSSVPSSPLTSSIHEHDRPNTAREASDAGGDDAVRARRALPLGANVSVVCTRGRRLTSS